MPVRNLSVDHVYQADVLQADHIMVKRMVFGAIFTNILVFNTLDVVPFKIQKNEISTYKNLRVDAKVDVPVVIKA